MRDDLTIDSLFSIVVKMIKIIPENFQKEHRWGLLKTLGPSTMKNVLFFERSASFFLQVAYLTFFSTNLPCRHLCPCTYVLQPGLLMKLFVKPHVDPQKP